ncbi:transposase family protein [Hymenobacter siberiensis]|uniref:transposase family protein n=1 Tax=Hymenobacter siberiensis TaxID=2848396 RepID=UPI001C1DFE06|nr:transposase family protein [Hymenobacter siberiensis]
MEATIWVAPYEVALKTEEELLLFTLFSFKANLTYDLLGLVSGMDGSNAKRNQELGITVLQEALEQTGHAPKREFTTVAEFEAYFQEHETLLVDGTEQRKQRPGNKEMQKDYYSGKKNARRKRDSYFNDHPLDWFYQPLLRRKTPRLQCAKKRFTS